MIVDAQDVIGWVKVSSPEILGRSLEGHVTAVTVLLRLLRVIKTAGFVAGNAAQQVSIVMVLAAEELFVMVEFVRNADLVAGGTEFRSLVQILKKGLLVEFGFGFDQLLIDELEELV